MNRDRAAVLALLVWTAPAAAECPSDIVLKTTDAADGNVRIPVGLAGATYDFTLDTGAPVSTLRESVAAELRLPRQPIPLDIAAGATSRPFQESTTVKSVGFGGKHFADMPFLIEPLSHAANERAGLIGADLFAAYDLELDYAHHRIALLPPGTCRPSGMTALPLKPARGHHLMIALGLDGVRADGMIDTGASQSVIRLDAAHRLFGLDPSDLPRLGEMLGVDGGRVAAYFHQFRSLSLGPLTLSGPLLFVIPEETQRLHRPLSLGDGPVETGGLPDIVLGMPVLRRLHLIVAYREGIVYAVAAQTP